MKRILLIAIIIALQSITSNGVYSQKILDQMVNETCECFESTPEDISYQKFELKLSECMLQAVAGKEKQIQKQMGLSTAKLDEFKELGGRIGERLATACPHFKKILMDAVKRKDENLMYRMERHNEGDQQHLILMGTVTKVYMEPVFGIDVQGTTNSYRAIGLSEFKGSELAMKGEELIGKSVMVEYTIANIFHPETGTEQPMIQIFWLRLQD